MEGELKPRSEELLNILHEEYPDYYGYFDDVREEIISKYPEIFKTQDDIDELKSVAKSKLNYPTKQTQHDWMLDMNRMLREDGLENHF